MKKLEKLKKFMKVTIINNCKTTKKTTNLQKKKQNEL